MLTGCREAKPQSLFPNRPHLSFTVNLLAHKSKTKSSISTTITSIKCLPGPKEKATAHPLAPQNMYQNHITEISVLALPLA
jgi:hypothetical protein